jgi:hypothetical protein
MNYLARLEEALPPLQRIVKAFDAQSKMVKEINTSIKQLQRQIFKIRALQKGNVSRVLIEDMF